MLAALRAKIQGHPFVWAMVCLAMIFYGAQLLKGPLRMHDIEVDYTAAQHLISGGSIYNEPFGLKSGFFKYSPFTLFPLIPLALLPLPVAKTAHFLVTVLLIVVTTLSLERFLSDTFFRGRRARANTIMFLSTLVVAVLYERELGLGNHNVMLLGMLLWSLRLILARREYSAGLLIGLALLMKPHFLVLVPLLVLRGRIKTLVGLVACVCGGVVLPAVILGVQRSLELHSAWVRTMVNHNAGVTASVNTLQWLLYRPVVRPILGDVGAGYALGVIAVAALIVFLFVALNHRRERSVGGDAAREALATKAFVLEYVVVVALIPNLVVTDSEHFLWSLPVVMFIVGYLVYEHRRGPLLPAWSILVFFLYGCDWYEVWGRTISTWIEESGALGVGNLLMLLTAAFLFGTHDWIGARVE
ncbi:MAG: DUF2029 domain-containing protein, partial [Acidobacteria bacterium]|nr:DUF2029 domain-containing protein [Acidobacteriota bacterium]